MRTKLLILLLLLSISVFSQENTEETSTERVDEKTLSVSTSTNGNNQTVITADNTIGIRDYLFMVFILILVIGALYFVLKVVKKLGGNRLGVDNDLIHVLSTKSLKGTTALHLVEVGKQIFLIGATDSSINSIAEITEKETKDMIALNLSAENVPQTSFFQFFTDKLKNNSVANGDEQATPIINTQKDKLDRY